MTIDTINQFRAAVRHGKYAWPGGYPTFFLCDDGATLCHDCAKSERRNILEAIANDIHDGWRIVGMDINYEDNEMHCDNCNKQIESAYGED